MTITAPLAFVDCETTGLDPDRHEIWEVGLILRTEEGETEYLWHLPVDLGQAEAIALTIGGYYKRWTGDARGFSIHPGGDAPTEARHKGKGVSPEAFAREFARLTHGAHLVGAVPSFDDAFLKRLLRGCGACPGWHYHLVDVEALAIGWLAGSSDETEVRPYKMAPPWNSNELSKAIGVDPDQFDRHTALGDARWAKAIYDAVMG